MKRIMPLLALIALCSPVFAEDKPLPRMNSYKDAEASGLYWAGTTSGEKRFDFVPTPPRIVYVVDTKAHICYAHSIWQDQPLTRDQQVLEPFSVVVVPCAQLKNRPEWKDKITWND